ncbi:MAG: hypothetical protein KME43_17915 [Myxacorys chilensis ATA2-1-KO14]|jgi:hypothetical protein|nr:hypothetical protein [Myxacorys chilensis ATA2-1-KO14]
MASRLNVWLLLSVLAAASLVGNVAQTRAFAQEPSVAAICNPDQTLESKVIIPLEQARNALDAKNGDLTIGALQEGLAIAPQLSNSQIQAGLIEQWFLETNGYPVSRFERLMQLMNRPQQPAQLELLLDQFLQLANRLTPGTSYIKTRGLAAIARQYTALSQPQKATIALSQARQTSRLIRGAVFSANALIEVAQGYAAIAQPQPTQEILAQVEQALQQIPANTSESIKVTILERMAAIYAQIGNYATAQQIATRIPKNSDSQSIALRGIAEAYITAQKLQAAEQINLAIAAPSQKVPVLGQLAVAYSAKQPSKATQLFRQALQLAQSPTVARDMVLQESLLKGLVNAHLQVGQRDEALQLTRLLKTSQTEAFKSVIAAYRQAGQTTKVKQLLSERLRAIPGNNQPWSQIDIWELLQIAVGAKQFDWIGTEWTRISGIDYGLHDWQIVNMATVYAETAPYEQAVQWVNQLPLDNRPLSRIRSLAAIALTMHRSGNVTLANQLLKQTQQRIDVLDRANRAKIEREGGDLFDRDRFKPQALAAIALVYAQTNQAEFRPLLKQVSQLDVNMSDPAIAPPADNPFAVFMEAEQYVGAFQLAQDTKDQGIREGRLQSSATALLKQNRFDLVLPVVNQLTSANNKTALLLAIAQRYGELQQLDRAMPILAQAVRVAQIIPGEESQVDRFGLDGATVLESSTDRGSFLEAIAVQYAQFKQPAEALKVANLLQEKQTREAALQAVRCVQQSSTQR